LPRWFAHGTFFIALVGLAHGAVDNALTVSTESLFERAFVLDEGKSVPRDAAGAAELYRQAAKAGDAHAHFRLGYLAETGDGVPQDYRVARDHYEAAVAAGLNEARLRLAICHLEGWGGPVDREAFVRELRTAAEAGYVDAQRFLSTLYFSGFAVKEDRAEALKWMERAATQDDLESQYELGRIAEPRWKNVMPDVQLARRWYELSAQEEYQTSMRAMARTFLHGPRDTRNVEMGRRWLELATETGDAEAPYILAAAETLHPRKGIPDETQVRAWLKLAADRKNERAEEVLLFEAGGRTLRDSLLHVLNQPAEERFLERANRDTDFNAPTHPPKIYRAVQPTYPNTLRLSGLTGVVQVEFIVDKTGRVRDPRVLKTPHPLFSERAIEAVLKWEFLPAKKDGRLVNTRLVVPIVFNLEEEQLSGVEGMLAYARTEAEAAGTIPREDYQELRPAKPARPLPRLRMPDGSTFPPDAKVLVLLVIDASGKPLRGHILQAEPAAAGAALLEAAMSGTFEPRLLNGSPIGSNVVLPYFPATRDK
jgi:TonB family protein